MRTTAQLFQEWSEKKRQNENIENELKPLVEKSESIKKNKSAEMSSDYVDSLFNENLLIERLTIQKAELKKRIDEIDSDLKNRFQIANTNAIRIASNQYNIPDTEIFIDEDGTIKSYARG